MNHNVILGQNLVDIVNRLSNLLNMISIMPTVEVRLKDVTFVVIMSASKMKTPTYMEVSVKHLLMVIKEQKKLKKKRRRKS